jgi:hypothetical protein
MFGLTFESAGTVATPVPGQSLVQLRYANRYAVML